MNLAEGRVLSNNRCLDNIRFQSWLRDTNISVTRAVLPQEISIGDLASFPSQTMMERFAGEVSRTPGSIYSKEGLARIFYGSEGKGATSKVCELAGRTKKRINNPDALTTIHKIGFGVGIERFELSDMTLTTAYFLWKRLGAFVPEDSLARALFLSTDQSAREYARKKVQALRGQLKDNPQLEIDTALSQGNIYHRLRKLKEEGGSMPPAAANQGRPIKSLEGVYQSRFQDWLADDSVGLFRRQKDLPGQTRPLEFNRDIHPRVLETADAILEFSGYIAPRTVIWRNIYGSKPYNYGVFHNRLTELRQALVDPSELRTINHFGITFGLSEVRASRAQLRLLHQLWKNFNVPVAASTLTQLAPKEALQSHLSSLRRLLVNTPYQIWTSFGEKVDDAYGYILVRKSD